jgi:uncharacterized damage-inducible protein DinB
MYRSLLVACCIAATALDAQPPATPTMSGALKRSFDSVADFIVRSAEQMPEDKYAYRATADTRTFADEIGHVADSHFFFCARAKNEAMPQRQALENVVKDKARLVAGIKESVTYCKAVYDTMNDSLLAQTFQAGQVRGVRLAPLSNNTAHDNEHYGKIVTLLRLNGLVPPSSQPRQ